MYGHLRLVCATAVLCGWGGAAIRADIIHVDAAVIGGAHDGTSWPDAFTELQAALAVATRGDQVWVAEGTHKPDYDLTAMRHTADRTSLFVLNSGVKLYGGFPAGGGDGSFDARDPEVFVTTLTGDLNDDDIIDFPVFFDNSDDNSFSLVWAAGTDVATALDGLTLRQSYAVPETLFAALVIDDGNLTVNRCRFVLNTGGFGGAVRIQGGSPALHMCSFIQNNGSDGGGIYAEGGSPVVSACLFDNNIAGTVGGGVSGRGANLMLSDCDFIQNLSGLYAGGGLSLFEGSAVIEGCNFIGNDAWEFGGAVHSSNATISMTDCIFQDNIVGGDSFGGGVALLGIPGEPPQATLTACSFLGNTSLNIGGGLLNSGASTILRRCSFEGNIADIGGGIWNDGVLRGVNCTFVGNTGTAGGGGAVNIAELSLASSTFEDNVAELISGGGLVSSAAGQSLSLVNCLFQGNHAADQGGGLWTSGALIGALEITHCTFAGNTASAGGAIFSGGRLPVGNSVLWGNGPDQISGSAAVRFSDVQGGWPGPGNIDADPLFIDDGVGPLGKLLDFRLQPDSPCIDAADNTVVPADADDLDGDRDVLERTPFDLDGMPRFVDDPAVVDTGVADPPAYAGVADMGAYELQVDFDCIDFEDCADTDGDGIRDDGCIFWECLQGVCIDTAMVYADMGGSNGACPVDGVADGNDRFHALNCFSNQTTTAEFGYPCEMSPPTAYHVDVAGLDAPCSPDGVCDGNDAFAALNAFSGSTSCSCAGGPAPTLRRTRR